MRFLTTNALNCFTISFITVYMNCKADSESVNGNERGFPLFTKVSEMRERVWFTVKHGSHFEPFMEIIAMVTYYRVSCSFCSAWKFQNVTPLNP